MKMNAENPGRAPGFFFEYQIYYSLYQVYYCLYLVYYSLKAGLFQFKNS